MSDARYVQIARDLSAQIGSGKLPVGSFLPKEVDLAVQLGVSRHTVRAAIHELEQLGLVSRRKKAGTRIEAAQPDSQYRQSLSTLEDLIHFGASHSRVLQTTEAFVTDAAQARMLGGEPGTPWLRISFLRMAATPAGKPIGWTDVYVDARQGDLSTLPERVAAAPEVLVATLLETHYGRRVAQVRQDVQATLVPPELAAPLQAAVGSAALRIVRRYLDDQGRLIDLSITLHPADRYIFSVQLDRALASSAAGAV